MTDVRLIQLKPESPDIARVRALNAEAFPPEERIDVDYLLEGLEGLEQEVLGIYADGRFAGFFAMTILGRCAYISYFAVCSALRSGGIGSAALKRLCGHYPDCQIVVDFEAPDARAGNNATRLRRRGFYLRNGFHPTGYFQYYMDTEFEIACSQPEYDRAGYEALVRGIHAQVPSFDPHHYRKDAC